MARTVRSRREVWVTPWPPLRCGGRRPRHQGQQLPATCYLATRGQPKFAQLLLGWLETPRAREQQRPKGTKILRLSFSPTLHPICHLGSHTPGNRSTLCPSTIRPETRELFFFLKTRYNLNTKKVKSLKCFPARMFTYEHTCVTTTQIKTEPCCPIQSPLASCGYWLLEMWNPNLDVL